jgi:hypothetical protein
MSGVVTRTQCAMTFPVPELPNLREGIHCRLMDAEPLNGVTFTSNPLRSAVGWVAWSDRGNYH